MNVHANARATRARANESQATNTSRKPDLAPPFILNRMATTALDKDVAYDNRLTAFQLQRVEL
ncbi:hypothetical protein AMATHDRAFT_64392 [Amanita thiersii Skay4041]|uniref:Uncharacterized protein n=1 Tax=Amanita thiersii Skay4041 TaxID=703135 RepID=A0A2A9NM93_9AGAR|nr:hypothetical protein AMATHDRAFT_64392 [Amanita thiersii Skay4041]